MEKEKRLGSHITAIAVAIAYCNSVLDRRRRADLRCIRFWRETSPRGRCAQLWLTVRVGVGGCREQLYVAHFSNDDQLKVIPYA